MSSDAQSFESSFFPEESIHPQVAELLDGQPKESTVVESALLGWDEVLEEVAADLYRIASMLLGDGEETIHLIEQTIADVDLASCHDPFEARHQARLTMAAEGIALLAGRDSTALATALQQDGPVSCIEDDDLESAGVSPAELEQMIAGPDNHRLRDWLESLTPSLRAIFVLRALAGLSSAEVAGLLAEHGGPAAQDWTPDTVRSTFRQALCSLASQLIHVAATR